MKPKISVIIPTFNRCELLKRAISSIINQTIPPDEIIVIDDGSADGSQEMIRKNFPSVICYTQMNQGVSSARNNGIRKSSGDWVAFLDSDDEWLPEKLEKQIKALSFNRDILVFHSNETWIRNGKRVNPHKKHRKYGGNIFQNCLPLCVISPSSVLIHKSVFEQVGLFDESLPACEDYDMWLRICCQYPLYYHEEQLIVKYGGHKDQLSQKYWGMDRFRIRALEKILISGQLNQDDYQAALGMLLKKLQIYINGAQKRDKLDEAQTYLQKQSFYQGILHNTKYRCNR